MIWTRPNMPKIKPWAGWRLHSQAWVQVLQGKLGRFCLELELPEHGSQRSAAHLFLCSSELFNRVLFWMAECIPKVLLPVPS